MCSVHAYSHSQGVKQVDAKLVSEAARAYFELEVQNTVLFDGVEEMLAALHNKGLRLAIITNSADTIKQKEIIDRVSERLVVVAWTNR